MTQPFLSNGTMILQAPVQAWSAPDGQINTGIDGIYCGDFRVARKAVLDIPGKQLDFIHSRLADDGQARFSFVVRTPERGADPSVIVSRARATRLTADDQLPEVAETITVQVSPTQTGDGSRVQVPLVLTIATDAAAMLEVKSGTAKPEPQPLTAIAGGAQWNFGANASVTLTTDAEVAVTDDTVTLTWNFELAAGDTATATWGVALTAPDAPFTVVNQAWPLAEAPKLQPAAPDSLRRLLAISITDLGALRMRPSQVVPPATAQDFFAGAGAPWYLTLFGRDALITARLLLPYFRDLALGTVRVLASRQGTQVDQQTGEQPGKILHEVRQQPSDLHDGRSVLPPVYYGTIDATCLWLLLVAELDLAEPELRELRPAIRAASGWLLNYADADGDGFIEYHDESGSGLANQGWKDSGDAMRFADGTLAESPISLVEVQGYGFAAARAVRKLLPGSEDERLVADLQDFADRLQVLFRERFWISDAQGKYPAMALDAGKRPVSGVGSNMGHLLGTGLLNQAESDRVVARLLTPQMWSGYGVRTLSSDNGGYWPLGYHVGSVWTHDTAMIISGMLASGHTPQAAELARGLLRAGAGFNFRMPELFGGQDAADEFPPVPYPASCRPQAWAAASAVVIARALGALQ